MTCKCAVGDQMDWFKFVYLEETAMLVSQFQLKDNLAR